MKRANKRRALLGGFVLGVALFAATGCGMPPQQDFSSERASILNADKSTFQPDTIAKTYRQNNLGIRLQWKVARLLPPSPADSKTQTIKTVDAKDANSITAQLPRQHTLRTQEGVPTGNAIDAQEPKTIAPKELEKHTADLSPKLERSSSTLANTTGQIAGQSTPKLSTNTCVSGLRLVQQQPSNQATLQGQLSLQWDVHQPTVGEIVNVYLNIEEKDADLAKVEGEQPIEVERINQNTWRFAFPPHQKAGQQFKAIQLRHNGNLYRLGFCYNVK